MWFSYITRIILSSLLFAFAIFEFWKGEIGNGIFILLITIISVITIFFNEVMMLVFLNVRKGNFDKAAQRLGIIKKPNLMIKGQEAIII